MANILYARVFLKNEGVTLVRRRIQFILFFFLYIKESKREWAVGYDAIFMPERCNVNA